MPVTGGGLSTEAQISLKELNISGSSATGDLVSNSSVTAP